MKYQLRYHGVFEYGLNKRYYYIQISEDEINLCGNILPSEKYHYKYFPMVVINTP